MLLGDHLLRKKTFINLDAALARLKKVSSGYQKIEEVNCALLELIQKEPEPCFLLSPVLDFISRVDREGILDHYTFTSFELWLNQASLLSPEENLKVRAKIVGKWIERNDYQAFFPIGMGKMYEGTHFVTAHKSPDLDTTIASFWGWVDAFGARVGNSLHIWNLPGGPPASQIEIQWLFSDYFGPSIFTHLAKTKLALSLTGKDLMTQQGMVVKSLEDSLVDAEHDASRPAVVMVDQMRRYLGDWRSFDVEGVRQVIIMLNSCLRWFENHLYLHMVSLFAKKKVVWEEITAWVPRLFLMRIEDCDPARELSVKQTKEVFDFMEQVLGLSQGMKASFEELGICLAKLAGISFTGSNQFLDAIRRLFDEKGHLIENRMDLFSFLEIVIRELHSSLVKVRSRLEKLDIALKTKEQVFGRLPTFVTLRSEVEEIRHKMGSYVSLTVTYENDRQMFPVGVIHAATIRKQILGTVSLRDFCNRDEMTIPSYLDVISVIDHHKSQLQTYTPPFAIISDAQSSNSLVARQAFEINDRYSSRGQSLESIEKQISQVAKDPSESAHRLMQRLLRKRAAVKQKGSFFIDEEREYAEYLHFLYGILDDTDLLSKVSYVDVECVASLVNRLKSIAEKKEVEVISLEDLPRDQNFPKKAAERILRNEDMYSLYRKAYEYREKEVTEQIELVSRKKESHFFDDTKEQNGCCRIGQAKIFASNVSIFRKEAEKIRAFWVEVAKRVFKDKPDIDLHLQMVSTIVSAEEVFRGFLGKYSHQDEMWIWVPESETALEHLRRFLNAFQFSPGFKENPVEVEIFGPRSSELESIFKESFLRVPYQIKESSESLVVIYYRAGSLNSRKAMVSPFLPKLGL